MSDYWPSRVTSHTESTTTSYKELNKPLSDLEARTNYLRRELDAMSGKEFVSMRGARLAPESKAGQAMAWSASRRLFAPAQAGWSSTGSASGMLVPGDVSVFAGILVEKFTETLGEIALGGVLRAFEGSAALFGTDSPAAGLYYLSGSSPGTLSAEPAANPVMAAQLTSDGDLLLVSGRSSGRDHEHVRLELPASGWVGAEAAEMLGAEPAAGAVFGYAPGTQLDELTALYTGRLFLTDSETGLNIPESSFELDSEGLWWLGSEAPANALTAWLDRPMSSGGGPLKALGTSTPDELTVSVSNGVASIGMAALTETAGALGGVVVKGISGRKVVTGPVVEAVLGDYGISVSSTISEGRGIVTVSSSEWAERMVDGVFVHGTAARSALDDGIHYWNFYKGSPAYACFEAPVPKWNVGTRYLKVWLCLRGAAGGQFPIEPATVTLTVFDPPTLAGVSLPTPKTITVAGFSPCRHDRLHLMETDEAYWPEVLPESTAFFKVAFGGIRDVHLLRAGVTAVA